MTSDPYRTAVARLRTAWQERAIALKAVSFGLIGVLNTVIDLGVFLVAYGVLELPLVAGERHRLVCRCLVLLCDELIDHVRHGVRRQAALEGLCGVRGFRYRRRHRQHHRAGGRVLFHAGAGR